MNENSFQIHPQLLEDCHPLRKLDVCHVLLHKNAVIPWFILVPETTSTDFFEIAEEKQYIILNECKKIAAFIKRYFNLTKINFATIGNVVPQLHLHVIGRHQGDTCWPKPIWGNLRDIKTYSNKQIDEIQKRIHSMA